MSSDENKAAAADKPTEDDGAKKAVADTDDDEDRVSVTLKAFSHQILNKYCPIYKFKLYYPRLYSPLN